MNPAFEDWVNEARAVTVEEAIALRGIALKRQGHELVGACPVCGGRDRFSVNVQKNVFHCRQSSKGGDAIALIEYVDGCDFRGAVEVLTGRPAPDGVAGEGISEEEKARREAARLEAQRKREEIAEAMRMRSKNRGFEIWQAAKPAGGTLVEEYFKRRGLGADIPKHIRFAPALPYVIEVGGGKFERVGVFPAMVAGITDATGHFGAVHVTWLDLSQPKGKALIEHNGERLVSKKVYGSKKAGSIKLFAGNDTLIIGEGIETVLSVRRALMEARSPLAEATFWTGADLGNLGGKAAGSVEHPTLTRETKNGQVRKVKVPSAVPDMTDERALMPPDEFNEIILLGDGDSDRFTTENVLIRAALRWAIEGRRIRIAWAAAGKDFNDMVLGGV